MQHIAGISTWASRDRAFYSLPCPQMDYDENVQPRPELPLRFDRMLNKFCGFHCWVQWRQGERLFCEHNRACCLSCGLTWIRFDTPEGHSVLEDQPCRRGVDQSTVTTISHYRWAIYDFKYRHRMFEIVKSIQTTVDIMMKSTPCLLHHTPKMRCNFSTLI